MLMKITTRFVVVCKDIVHYFLDKNCPNMAAAIAFYALFSVFPLLLALISATSFVLGSQALETQLARDLGSLVPVSTTFVTNTIAGVVGARAVTGVASIIGLLVASIAVFTSIRKGVNAAWGIQTSRPFLHERLIDVSLMLGASLMLLLSISATAILRFLEEIMGALAPGITLARTLIWEMGASAIPPLLTLITFLALYRYLPNTRVTFREVWPGALLAAVAFEVAKNVFVWYVGTYPAYKDIYGSVGTVVALLAWVYLSAVILLMGALVTSRHAAYISVRAEQTSAQAWNGLRTRINAMNGK